MEQVRFSYSRAVHWPPPQAGRAGQTRELARTDAEHLAALGYGHIETEETDVGTTDTHEKRRRGQADRR